jgi:hypothetical protein
LSEQAGQSSINGKETDKFGNPIGVELIPDGGCQGYKVMVLQCYSQFDISPCRKALEQMGFEVQVFSSLSPDVDIFKQSLLHDNKVQQLWVISTNLPTFSGPHLDVIQQFHQASGALYLWGDNDPFNTAVNERYTRH